MERPAASQQHQQRPRSKSTFSLKSIKSHSSHNTHDKHHKEHYRESVEQKRRTHISPTTKANPNAAMNEAQPIAAALEKPTLQSLRSFQHVDINGNPIADPDRSNPTRHRWERPLDTIRSFEAAIDREYRQQRNSIRADAQPDYMNGYNHPSRRSSYYGNNGYDQPGNRFSTFSNQYPGRAPRDSWAENGYPNSYGPPRARFNRMQSDNSNGSYPNGSHPNGRLPNGQEVYPNNGYQRSRDTVNTGISGGSQSDPYSNEQSSDSSYERPMPVQKPDLGEQYGFSGFGGGPILEEYPVSRPQDGYLSRTPNGINGTNGMNGPPPPVPAHGTPPNNPNVIKLGGGQSQAPAVGGAKLTRNNPQEKRKSWFKRRFSKDN